MESNELQSSNSCTSNTSVSISNLPWEVLQEIFLHLNGKSLVACKRVCKSWMDHVHYLEQKHTFWYNCCQKEIPSWVQLDISDNVYPSHWMNQSRVDWRVIYKCWYTWDTLRNLPSKWENLVSGFNGISCMKVSGQWLLVSTGIVGSKKLTAYSLQGKDHVDIYVGTNVIVNFELVNSDKQYTPNMKPQKIQEELFSTLDHNEIWIELYDSYIQLRENYHQTVDKMRQTIRHSYGYEVKLLDDGVDQILNLNKTCDNVIGPEIMELHLPNGDYDLIDVWMDKVTILDLGRFRKLFHTLTVNVKSLECNLNDSGVSLFYEDDRDRAFYVWHGSLYVAYTSNRCLRFHVNGETAEQKISFKRGCITSVLVHTYYLFLGTDRGELLIYRLENPKDCLSIVVNETESWTIKIAFSTITHIAVVEPTHCNSKRPKILCASPEDIYLISFPDQDENRT